MPLIHITLAGPTSSDETVRRLQLETTRLMQEVLHKETTLTVVAVAQLPSGAVAAAGHPVPVGASLQALITAGSNDDASKAAFVSAATRMLSAAIGESAAPIYVALHEMPATAWGYDGRTQAARRAERQREGE